MKRIICNVPFLGILFLLLAFSNQIKATEQEKKKIIFIGTSWVIAKYIETAVNELGYKAVFFVEIDDFSPQIGNVIKQSEWYNVNIKSYSAIEQFLEENREKIGEIAGITSLADSKLSIAQKLAEKFQVVGPDKTVSLLSDKNAVYHLIPEFSPQTIHFSIDRFPISAIHGMIERYGAVVIKPVKGSGALGTVIIKEKIDRSEICAQIQESGISNLNSVEWIAQAFIDGTLYSLEGYCLEGKLIFLGLTRRSRVAMTEMANHFPSDHNLLIQKNKEMLYGGIRALTERSGFKKGYFHCEFLVNDRGAYLIDANFGRIGGAAMIEQFAHSFGITPQEMTKHVIDVCLFGGQHLPGYTYKFPPCPSLCLCYGISEEAVVHKVNLPTSPLSYHTIVVKEKISIPPVGNSDYSWVGMISGDPDQVLEEIGQITIETDKGLVPAYYYID